MAAHKGLKEAADFFGHNQRTDINQALQLHLTSGFKNYKVPHRKEEAERSSREGENCAV